MRTWTILIRGVLGRIWCGIVLEGGIKDDHWVRQVSMSNIGKEGLAGTRS